ncbi:MULTISPECIES: MFS transporter [Streptomyces]|uniref:MFS transporter n=1 Tax=Streptomyces glycanivorans TaxID=3033808 RepID=A0ABY9J5T8_9ACTN|nr:MULTISPECIES: MFS transporter [unclassified Streptomyces]WLQ63023.1 MFS transporter [Streptomyces sp. Alt3]WSQ76537.1 MFS transporter [Streptomyces sp. NBC_01213]WSQ83866.1 MFS transporter [Streptomyces sp. NBC_01212]WSR10187.1 MFS transporter [Streptomyces sp. NBC_01208]
MSSTLSETSLVQRPRRFFLCLILVTALGALDHTIVATALPDIAGELGSPQRTSWVVAAYTLAITAAMPAVGALGDRFGRRQVLAGSVLVFLIASVACGLATGIEMLALARFFQGLGGAGLLVLPQAVVADVVPVRERAAYLGPLGAVFAVATVVSPLLGGWLTDFASWRWTFWINLPIGALALLFVLVAVPGTGVPVTSARPRFDTVGAALIAVSAVGFVLVASAAGEAGWTPGVAVGAALTAVLTAVTLWWESRCALPVLPVRTLVRGVVAQCCALGLLAGLGLFGALAYVPMWVEGIHGSSATVSGLMLLPVTLGIVAGINGSGLAVRKWGLWRPFPVAGCATAIGAGAALAVLSSSHPPLPVIALLLMLLGLGAGLFMQVVVVVAQDAAGREAAGAVTAGLSFLRELGVLAGAVVLGAVAAHGLGGSTDGARTAAEYGAAFTPVFAVTAACFAAGLVVALFLPKGRLGRRPDDRASGGAAAPPSA